jgi:Flp pilus assembly protein TadG
MHKLRTLLRRWRSDRRGNIAVITAMLLVPLVTAAGGAIDIGRLASVHGQLMDAADAASVGSVGKASSAMTAAALMATDGPIPAGVLQATQIFNADVGAMSGVSVNSLGITVAKAGQVVTSNVTVSASMPTYFLKLAGINTLTTTATSVSTNSLPTFIDFYLLLDNTPSMGIGATPTDVATMVANTPDQCAFACHDLSNNNNYYNLAKSLGVTMRIDVLRQATQNLMTTAQATETVANQFRMGIYTFGASSAAPGFYTISAPTTNLTSAQTTAGAIDLMTVPYQNYNSDQDTNFNSALTGANLAISNPGSGGSSLTPQKVLFLVSDGMNDAAYSGSCPNGNNIGGSRCVGPIDPSLCTAIKNRGITIAVLYTTYSVLTTDPWTVQNVNPIVPNVNPAMQACATTGYFFAVSPTQGISAAMNALFQKAVANAHILQ